jgi:hypothetical protein
MSLLLDTIIGFSIGVIPATLSMVSWLYCQGRKKQSQAASLRQERRLQQEHERHPYRTPAEFVSNQEDVTSRTILAAIASRRICLSKQKTCPKCGAHAGAARRFYKQDENVMEVTCDEGYHGGFSTGFPHVRGCGAVWYELPLDAQ